jgi:hypothetical protein
LGKNESRALASVEPALTVGPGQHGELAQGRVSRGAAYVANLRTMRVQRHGASEVETIEVVRKLLGHDLQAEGSAARQITSDLSLF